MATLSTDQIAQLRTDGFLLVSGALDEERDLRPVEREFEAILDRLANRLHAEGKIPETYPHLPFAERFIAVAAASPEPIIYHFEIALSLTRVDADSPINCGPATFNFLRSPRILDLLEPLIGGEIYANPVQHTRIKLPPTVGPQSRSGNLTDATQWHQDQGVVLPEADHTETITVWAAMTDATEESGCLVYEKRSHRNGLAFHCPADAMNRSVAVGIPPEWIDSDRSLPVPAKRGDLLLHLPLTKHGSLPNQSNTIRWSFDLRYHPIGQPTGRPVFPGFIARSRANPASELQTAEEWRALWEDARQRLAAQPAPTLFRWNTDAAVCA